MTIKEYFEFSRLSQAAYALFTSDVSPGAVQNALIAVDAGDFTTKQAEAFTDADTGYTLIPNSHQPDDAVGFSASLFQSNANGELTLAIRGTAGFIDLIQDSEILTRGFAEDQIYSLYNYVQRLQRLGLIPTGTRINVTGHSLGGHLALAFSRLFPNLVDEVYTYNAPGFKDNSEVNNFFASLGGAATFPSDRITNINADARAEIIAGLHQLPGPPSQNIFIVNNRGQTTVFDNMPPNKTHGYGDPSCPGAHAWPSPAFPGTSSSVATTAAPVSTPTKTTGAISIPYGNKPRSSAARCTPMYS